MLGFELTHVSESGHGSLRRMWFVNCKHECWNTNQSYRICLVSPLAATSVAYLWHHLMTNQVTVGCGVSLQWLFHKHDTMDTSACAALWADECWNGYLHCVQEIACCHQRFPRTSRGIYWKHWPADIWTCTVGILLRLWWDPLEGLACSGRLGYHPGTVIVPVFHLRPSAVLLQQLPSR